MIEVESDFAEALKRVPTLERATKNALRKTLRAAADEGKVAVQEAALASKGRTSKSGSSIRTSTKTETRTTRTGRSSSRTVHRSLRRRLADAVTVEVPMSASRTEVDIKVKRSKLPPEFAQVAHLWNGSKGWRHPVFAGRKPTKARSATALKRKQARYSKGAAWVHQVGNPGFFDRTLNSRRAAIAAQLEQEIRKTVEREFRA